MRQADVETDGLGTRVRRTAIRRFHDPRPASRHDHVIAAAGGLAGCGHEPSEFTRFVVVAGQCNPAPSKGQRACQGGIGRILVKLCFDPAQRLTSRVRLRQARAPEDHDRGSDPLLFLNQFRLEEFQTQPERAQFITLQKGEVAIGGNVGTGRHDRIEEGILAGREAIHGARL
jgi:hypothetical protein